MALLFPLTPFEYYYWCDDRPEYPTTFPIELTFRGRLQRTEFERAVERTVARHPLLRASVEHRRGRMPYWVENAGGRESIDWADASCSPDLVAPTYVDLSASSGLRIQVRTAPDTTRVVFIFHHACCDALGALQFVEELLVIYDALVRGCDDVRLPPLDSSRLPMRGDYGLAAADSRPTFRDVWMTLRVWATRLLRRWAVVAAPRQKETDPEPDDRGYLTAILDAEDVEQLHAAAARAGVTLNDLMARDLFLVLQRWNLEHGAGGGRLSLNVPVSLRTRVDRQMPAANSLGFWFLDRNAADCADPAALLQSIHAEMANVKTWRLPLYFVGGLRIAAGVPGLMRALLRRKASFATAVFSNVGRVFGRTPLDRRDGRLVCGQAVLERITGVPPIRPGTRVAIVSVTYAGEMTLNLNYDALRLSAGDGRRLLALFLEQLRRSAAGSGERAPVAAPRRKPESASLHR